MANIIERFIFAIGSVSCARRTTIRITAAAGALMLAACAQGDPGVGIGIGTGIGFGPVGVGVGATVPLIDPGIGNGQPGAGV